MKSKTVKALSKGRSMHLIDIENLCMDSNPNEEHVARAKAASIAKVQPVENDCFLYVSTCKSAPSK